MNAIGARQSHTTAQRLIKTFRAVFMDKRHETLEILGFNEQTTRFNMQNATNQTSEVWFLVFKLYLYL